MSGHYHNALYTGDVEERVKILKSLGQGNKSPGAIKLVATEIIYIFLPVLLPRS